MNETLGSGLYLLPLLLVVLLALWYFLRRRQRVSRSLSGVLDRIAHERIEDRRALRGPAAESGGLSQR